MREGGGGLQGSPQGFKHLPIHRLLGKPEIIQNPMEKECQMVTNGIPWGTTEWFTDPEMRKRGEALLESAPDEWRLLLQVDSDFDADMMWGDIGRLYFWIRDEDLKKRDFSRCWMILQNY